jgi:restriction endonuclease
MNTIAKKVEEVVGEMNRKYKLQIECDDTKDLNPSFSNIQHVSHINVKQILYHE